MMKELKMFPQITEETEENLLNLENDAKSTPYSTTPPSDSPTETPSSPNYENQVPCPVVTVTAEDADQSSDIPVTNTSLEEECATPPTRVRMRSLSGGAYRLAPTLPATGRMRRQSGDDVLTRVSPSRKAALFEHFRPRSKSDSKGKRPTFLTSLKNTIFSPQRKTSLEADPPPLDPLQPGGDYRQRSRSGSETRGGTMSKMIDLFRSRSNSLSIDSRSKKPLSSIVPTNALLRRHSVDPDKRRRPFSSAYRSLEQQHADSYSCHSEEDTADRIDYANLAEEKIIPTFLTHRTCYDVMPTSGKVVVLSLELLVKNAFEALVSNELRAAPLWNSALSSFIGMLTISDFINVLRHYYRNAPEDIKDIESQSIATWRKMNKIQKSVTINGMDNLALATKSLIEEGVHRIPVIDESRKCVLFVLTRKRLLHYIYYNIIEKFGKSIPRTPTFLNKSIRELNVGTFDDIATVTYKTTVIEALDLFMQRKVSALPIVDENNTVLDIFAKFDVFALAKEQTYHNLDMTIEEAIDKGTVYIKVHEDVYGCSLDDTLGTVIHTIVTSRAHRVVVIDEKKTPIGIVSLSDILKFLVVQPWAMMEEASGLTPTADDIIEETPEGAVGGAEADDSVFFEAKQKFDSTSPEKSASDVQKEEEDEDEKSKEGETTEGKEEENSDLAE